MCAPPIGSPQGEGKKRERKKKKKSARSMKRGCPSPFDGQTGNEARCSLREFREIERVSLPPDPPANHRSVVRADRPGRLISRRRDGKHTRTTRGTRGGGFFGEGEREGDGYGDTSDKHRTPFSNCDGTRYVKKKTYPFRVAQMPVYTSTTQQVAAANQLTLTAAFNSSAHALYLPPLLPLALLL